MLKRLFARERNFNKKLAEKKLKILIRSREVIKKVLKRLLNSQSEPLVVTNLTEFKVFSLCRARICSESEQEVQNENVIKTP